MTTTTLHAHWTSDARDCDGPISHFWDVAPAERYDPVTQAWGFDDEFDFETKMAEALVKVPYGGDGMVTITFDRTEDGRLRGTMSHETEEGYSARAFEVCKSDDFDPVPTQRDVYAERMGY